MGWLMRKDQRASLCAASSRSVRVAIAALAFATCGFASVAWADDLQPLRNVGDGYKSVKVITRYEIHAAGRTMDLVAATPSDPSLSKDVERELAGQTAREICANGTIKAIWTVRIFLPGETSPAASCRTGAQHGRAK